MIGHTQGRDRGAEGRLDSAEGVDETSSISDVLLLITDDLGDGAVNDRADSLGETRDGRVESTGLSLEGGGDGSGGHEGDGEEADGLHFDGWLFCFVLFCLG
jgi:hypothetical protein